MAFTLNNFIGFETGDLNEALSVANAPIIQTGVVATGTYALQFDNAAVDQYFVNAFETETSDAGDNYGIGFKFFTDSVSVSANYVVVRATGQGTTQLALAIDGTTGELVLLDVSLGEVGRESGASISVNTQHYIEIYWENADSAVAEVFVDGNQVISVTARDFFNTNDYDAFIFEGTVANSHNFYIDDVYCASGLTAASELLGPSEVHAYRSNKASATPDDGGADLDIGQWVDVQTIPFTVGTVGAEYTASGVQGAVDTNDVGGSAGTGGPNTDNNITGAINGVKAICRMERGGGGASTHHILLGNDGDGTTQGADLQAGMNEANFFFVSEAATIVPTASEYIRIGFRANGARDFECHDMLGQILHTPDAGGPIEADGDATLAVVTAAGVATKGVQASDGAPALVPFVAAGVATKGVQASDGAPELVPVEASGAADVTAPAIDADGDATLAVVTAAGVAERRVQADDGAPTLALVEGSGVATRGVQANDGAPELTPVDAAGVATRGVQASDGAPTLTVVEASGAASIGGADITADGDATLAAIEAAGTAERRVQADDGAPTLTLVEAAGTAERRLQASDGTPTIAPVDAAGVAIVHRGADGAASITVVLAAGVATVRRQASGAATLAVIQAAGVVGSVPDFETGRRHIAPFFE